MKKFVLIPDSFKGTMSSSEICSVMEEKIAEFERNHPEEEYEKLIAQMKAELEEIKASNPESAAEIADDIAAIEEKIEDAENGNSFNDYSRIIDFIIKIISLLFDLIF